MRREDDLVSRLEANRSPDHYQAVCGVANSNRVFHPEIIAQALLEFLQVPLLDESPATDDVPEDCYVFILLCCKGPFVIEEGDRTALNCGRHTLSAVLCAEL